VRRCTQHEANVVIVGGIRKSLSRSPGLGRLARYFHSYLGGDPWRLCVTHAVNRSRYSAVAHPLKVIWVDPHAIKLRLLVGREDLGRWRYGRIHGGDWDQRNVRSANDTDKVVSMQQRFVDGRAWLDTDLFRERYAKMIAEGIPVKGQSTLAALARVYESLYDPMYIDIAARGLVGPTLHDPWPTYLEVHIGRAGDVLGTSNGNHRLGMALALGLTSIPVRVATRHEAWQRVRVIASRGVISDFAEHPDLQDVRARGERHPTQSGHRHDEDV